LKEQARQKSLDTENQIKIMKQATEQKKQMQVQI
jgi:hypothetical protein